MDERVQDPAVRVRTESRYRARCACEWTGPERRDERQARADQKDHERQTGHVAGGAA